MNGIDTRGEDTIAALATAPGRGGIAIVRLSGSNVRPIMAALLKQDLPPRQATFLPFYAATGDVVDEGIALFFPAPHSFTGEDVLEFHGHGGPIVVDYLLQQIVSCGARIAKPGEFSERAFLNGKIDLAQAEAIADLINASSIHAARSAIRSLQGEFSQTIHRLTEAVIHVRLYIEAAIDFSEEEIDFLADEKIANDLKNISNELQSVIKRATQGSLLREGMTVVIAGKPNAGKSMLLNSLSGRETAIVTDIPGTTRDVLRDHIILDGMPILIIDTAGLRESEDKVEQEGIRRAHHEMSNADMILYVFDAAEEERPIVTALPGSATSAAIIFVRNKIDLIGEEPAYEEHDGRITISLSAKTGAGKELLCQQMKSYCGYHGATEDVFLARRRHLDALDKAQQHVERGLTMLLTARGGELVAEYLRQTQLALSEITGEFTSDDLLGRIFASFCIGK